MKIFALSQSKKRTSARATGNRTRYVSPGKVPRFTRFGDAALKGFL
jgi:hypothetical protein